MVLSQSILSLTNNLETFSVIASILILYPFGLMAYYVLNLIKMKLRDSNKLDKDNEDNRGEQSDDSSRNITAIQMQRVMTNPPRDDESDHLDHIDNNYDTIHLHANEDKKQYIAVESQWKRMIYNNWILQMLENIYLILKMIIMKVWRLKRIKSQQVRMIHLNLNFNQIESLTHSLNIMLVSSHIYPLFSFFDVHLVLTCLVFFLLEN